MYPEPMGDAYRDEKQAALASAAALRRENDELRAELRSMEARLEQAQQDAKTIAVRRPPRPPSPLYAVGAVSVAGVAILVMSLVRLGPTHDDPEAPPSVDFPGVAVAPPPLDPKPAPVAEPTDPTQPATPRPVATPANLSGDPLRTTPSPTPSALAASKNPADWQTARNILEPRVFAGHASPQEVRLLEAICAHQGDRTCVEACKQFE